MPEMKHRVGQLLQAFADAAGGAAAIAEGLQVAAEMGPAQLPLGNPVVGAIAITDEHAGKVRPQEVVSTFQVGPVADGKHGQVAAETGPEPALVGLLRPTGFIGMDNVGLLHMVFGFGDGVGDRGADALLDIADRAQADRDVERGGEQFLDLAFAEMITTGAQSDEGFQAWSIAAFGNAVGELPPGGLAALSTAQEVAMIFTNFWNDWWQLDNLMTDGHFIGAGQFGVTMATGLGNADDGWFAEFFQRYPAGVRRRMARLATALPAGRFLAGSRLRGMHSILRGLKRGRGVIAATAFTLALEALLEVADALLKVGDSGVLAFATGATPGI